MLTSPGRQNTDCMFYHNLFGEPRREGGIGKRYRKGERENKRWEG